MARMWRLGMLLLGTLAGTLGVGGAASAEGDPFEVQEIRAPGRPLQVHALPGPAGGPSLELVVASVEGSPPDEQRHLSVFRVGEDGRYGPAPALGFVVSKDVIAFDLGDADPAPGPEVVLAARDELRIRNFSGSVAKTVKLDAGLPLPPPARELSRLLFLGDWIGTGDTYALLPMVDGSLLVRLPEGDQTRLRFPVLAHYETNDGIPPVPDGLLDVRFGWADVARGQDDGDGNADVFALSRFDVSVFRSAAGRLPEQPSRRMTLRPFTAEEEIRHEATGMRFFVDDLNGDGLSDLTVHRTSGTLMASHATTEVHRNPGDGARVNGNAAWKLEERGSIATIDLVDLDGDGRTEVLQTRLRLGVMQVIRVLVTRNVEAELRVFQFGDDLTGAVESWSTSMTVPLDFDAGRIAGLFPNFSGDLNGDGRRDLVMGDGPEQILIQLGTDGEAGPGFSSERIRQTVPAAERGVTGDLDGDGVDDLVLYDSRNASGRLHVLRNLRRLPGTRPVLEPSE